MKKFLVIFFTVCLAAGAFAQENTSPKSTLYGYFRFDYDYNKAMSEDEAANELDGFNIARSRVGWELRMTDALKSVLELELFEKLTFTDSNDDDVSIRTLNIRLANIAWQPVENFTITAGKMYQAFTPESLDRYDDKTDGIQADYAFGIAKVIFQLGGVDDVDKQSLLIMPGVILTPDLGDLSLKAGANAQFVTPYLTDADMGIGLNAYAIIGIAGFEATLDVDALNLQNEATSMINAYATLKYKIEILKPVVDAYVYDIAGNQGDMYINIDFGAEIEPVTSFVIYPFLTLKNIGQANGGEMDWEFTMRFQWKPKYRF
jgi:hypothetical protein